MKYTPAQLIEALARFPKDTIIKDIRIGQCEPFIMVWDEKNESHSIKI